MKSGPRELPRLRPASQVICKMMVALCAVALAHGLSGCMRETTQRTPQELLEAGWRTYLRCRQHIEQNFLHIQSIHETASACYVDQAYLSRLFKRYAEEKPLQLLTRLKMARAAELLGSGELLIKQVAEDIGFADPYHFSRVFKRVYGVPPEIFIRTARRRPPCQTTRRAPRSIGPRGYR
jgi:AraC-like DNA-binding protein